jgi:signal transduction histidine kinase
MNDQLHIFICEHFKKETLSVFSSGEFPDVIPCFFPSRCNRPITPGNQLSSITEFSSKTINNKSFCGCSCLTKSDKESLERKNISYIHMESCFQMFTSKELIFGLINDGAYLTTPGWLSDWKKWINQWGGQIQAQQIFSESATKIILLDTGTDSNSDRNLKNFSETLNCRAETIKIGMDHFQLFLENVILKWRLEKKAKKTEIHNEKTDNYESDYAMALDLLSELPRAGMEEFVVNNIMELISMLFAPRQIHYLSIVNNMPGKLWSNPSLPDEKLIIDRLSKYNLTTSLTESGKGFCFKIGKENETKAIIEVDNLLIPEYISRYQNLGIAMAGVFALSIENARNFEEIMKINNELKLTNATKDKFFSIIAHDLRNPFAAIIGYSEMLKENIQHFERNKLESFINIIYDSTNQAYNLLDNLLIWAQAQKGDIEFSPETFNFKTLALNNVYLAKQLALKKEISIIMTIEEELPVFADKNMLNTIVQNLLTNAIKFTHPQGSVTISHRIFPEYTEISVADTGIGICDEVKNKLFRIDTHITNKGTENEKGTGLGLILCKEFIKKHGGKIWVESKVNEGSIFYFTIPNQNTNPA